MLQIDKDAIDRIIDRCAAGGSDNHYGARFNEERARHQFALQFSVIDLESPEGLELDSYFDERIRLEQEEDASE